MTFRLSADVLMAAADKVIGFLDELLRKSGREPYLDMTDYMRGECIMGKWASERPLSHSHT